MTFYGSRDGTCDIPLNDLAFLFYLIVFIAISAVSFGLIGSYIGINERSKRIENGALARVVAIGVTIIY